MDSLMQIQEMTTVINTVHESCYKSYHILEHVLKMVERGDSKETILEMVQLLSKK